MQAGFVNHAKVALASDATAFTGIEYSPNKMESICNGTLGVLKLPLVGLEKTARLVKGAAHDPRVVTVGVTALALYANAFVFYPTQTQEYTETVVDAAVDFLRDIPWREVVKYSRFATFAITETAITALGGRALGRFTNTKFTEQWNSAWSTGSMNSKDLTWSRAIGLCDNNFMSRFYCASTSQLEMTLFGRVSSIVPVRRSHQ